MAEIDKHEEKQLMLAAERYESYTRQAKRVEKPEAELDWRSVETDERILYRLQTLGLHELAGYVMGNEDEILEEGIVSAMHPDEKVSLLERIIQENDLISSRFLYRGSDISRTVGRILLRSRGRTVGFGTGFLVSPRLLLTNHHVLETKAVAGRAAVEFDYYERANGQSGPTILFELDPDTFYMSDEDLDFALVAVEQRSGSGDLLADRGWIPLIPTTGKALVGEPVNIIQHPGGQPQEIAIKNNNIKAYSGDFVHYEADTKKGSSGSPVLNMQWQLAALHHAGVPKRDEEGHILLIDGSRWNRTEEQIDQIHWIANEGVRISRIVEFIQNELGDEHSQARALFEETRVPAPMQPSPSGRSGDVRVFNAGPSHETVFEVSDHEISDEDLDNLSPEAIAQIIADLDRRDFNDEQGISDARFESAFVREAGRRRSHRDITLVAEGDSWFDYAPAGIDIIASLRLDYDWRIRNFANAGDTLEDIAWGMEYRERNWTRRTPQIETTLDAIRRYRPPIVLLSAGGNDLTDDHLLGLLNHRDSGLPPMRQDALDHIMQAYFPRAYRRIIESIWAIDRNIHIITHGYGIGVPDGRGVIRVLGRSFIGPWLRPAMTAKGHTDLAVREGIVRDLLTPFNTMLSDLAGADSRVHYINLMRHIQPTDWENELHLSNSAYRRVAGIFDRRIRDILRTL